ncbi:hypothetical protein PL81_41160 [Streptomyces sp. RSD-27]|nr:hypothetical protein PL81_41160 [Streptomyces sp. RSD-27]
MAPGRRRRHRRHRTPHRHPATGHLFAPLTRLPTRVLPDAERAAHAAPHGGCLTAASVHATADEATGSLTVHVLDPAGGAPLRAVTTGPPADPTAVGHRAGVRLLEDGAARLLDMRP